MWIIAGGKRFRLPPLLLQEEQQLRRLFSKGSPWKLALEASTHPSINARLFVVFLLFFLFSSFIPTGVAVLTHCPCYGSEGPELAATIPKSRTLFTFSIALNGRGKTVARQLNRFSSVCLLHNYYSWTEIIRLLVVLMHPEQEDPLLLLQGVCFVNSTNGFCSLYLSFCICLSVCHQISLEDEVEVSSTHVGSS